MTILRHWRLISVTKPLQYKDSPTTGDGRFGADCLRLRSGQYPSEDTGEISHEEATTLVYDGVYGELGIIDDSIVLINEHAHHAFQEFCCEVWMSWDKYRARHSARGTLDNSVSETCEWGT